MTFVIDASVVRARACFVRQGRDRAILNSWSCRLPRAAAAPR
jgi:hypothetical protein